MYRKTILARRTCWTLKQISLNNINKKIYIGEEGIVVSLFTEDGTGGSQLNGNRVDIIFRVVVRDRGRFNCPNHTAGPASPASPFLPFLPRLPCGPGGPGIT